MQKFGRQYVGLFNARHHRTGTLWEGRYKACLVGDERYVLTCQRYIESNSVRARMTDDPAAYGWSSCATHLGQRTGSMLTPHPGWLALDELTRIRTYMAQEKPLGDPRSGHGAKSSESASCRKAARAATGCNPHTGDRLITSVPFACRTVASLPGMNKNTVQRIFKLMGRAVLGRKASSKA